MQYRVHGSPAFFTWRQGQMRRMSVAVASRIEQLARGGASMRLRDLGRTLTILLSATCFWQRGGFSNNKPPQDFLFSWVVKKSNYRVWGRRTVPDGKCRQTWSSRSHSQSSSWSAATLEPRPHSLHRSLPKPTPRRAHRSSCMHTQQFVHAEETLTCHRC